MHTFKVQPRSQGSLTENPHRLRAYMQSDQGHSNVQPAENRVHQELGCVNPQNDSNQVARPAISQEVVRKIFQILSFRALILRSPR